MSAAIPVIDLRREDVAARLRARAAGSGSHISKVTVSPALVEEAFAQSRRFRGD